MFDITDSGALMPGDPVKIAQGRIIRMIAITNYGNDDTVAMASNDGCLYVARVDGTNSESH